MEQRRAERRGGKRIGAGRPPALTDEIERWGVGAWCEEESAKLVKAAIDTKISSIPRIAALDRERERILDREKNTGPGRGKYAEPLASYRKRALKRIEIDLARAFKKTLGSKRKFSVKVARPYALRPKILSAAVAHFRTQYGLHLSPRLVDQCWKEFRQLQRWLDTQPRPVPQA